MTIICIIPARGGSTGMPMKNLIKILNVKSISLPFYGNIMTFYAQKKSKFGHKQMSLI